MPFALREAGFGFGICLIVIMGYITDFSVRTLVASGLACNKPVYQDMVLVATGKWGFNALSFGQFFFPIFGMIAYGIIVGQTLPKVFHAIWGQSFLDDRHAVIAIFTLVLMMPLSMQKAIGVMAFAYVMHHNAFLIYASLKDTSMKNLMLNVKPRFAKVTHLSVVVAATMSIALGVGGFYPFGHETKDDVLDNFADDNSAANAARFFFALAIMLTYPIECFVAREVIENYFFSEQQPPSDLRHYTVSAGICLFCMSVSMIFEDLGVVLELNGIVNANLIAFILPGLSGAILLEGDRWYKGQRLGPSILAGFGFVLLIFGVILVILEQTDTA
ncbi:uncharacterized protein MONBRDRAFT_37692 [Monosiga brevicollis MX1]|uniref:Amino acid transporter transmembrane domain-containing protein n=1 Tax=Monosiga brevicollis TaxID=81824 RepID=A9V3B4_MONBE|nr:uncharacterized protein MONBRDRAFT_37692 [Monosiga brevicollis MX1]EDQ88030.1 predicted protein [Monosiga brevicollis MX1]|eukprot:XP_001747106.1 hypothetical protein [Monosiga brevicollis MX1]